MTRYPVFASHHHDWSRGDEPVGHASTARGANRVLRQFYDRCDWAGGKPRLATRAYLTDRDDGKVLGWFDEIALED